LLRSDTYADGVVWIW